MKKLIVILALILLVSCQTTITQPVTPGQGSYEEVSFEIDEVPTTKQFTSVNEFNAFINKYKSSGNNYYGGFRGAMMMMEDMAVAMEGGVAESAPAKAAPEYSETNVQVAGVDEADIIKSDGNYIYTITQKTLYIIKAYPGEDAEIVSTIKFDDNPTGLFVNGNNLAVFGNIYNDNYFKKINFRPQHGMSFFNIYDISNKEDPDLTKDYKFDGNYFRARMIDDEVYFVVNPQPIYRPYPLPEPRPVFFEGDEKRIMPISDIFYFDIPYKSPQIVSIHAIDLEDKEINSKSLVVEGSQNMYMSEENIYITYTEWINEYDIEKQVMMELLEPYLSTTDLVLIEKIKSTDNEVLSQAEKEEKIFQIYMSASNYLDEETEENLEEQAEELVEKKLKAMKYMEFTGIHKVEVEDGEIEVDANGKVPGRILNQFSMDENNEIFRIATTVSARWSRYEEERTESHNNVYTLNDDLEILGKLEGLAETESIFSTRFIGDMLYMVTFRQIDPFFVIDLSDPRNIKELGKLKIPGFSRYLHPFDEDTIIGIGQETEDGRTSGLKISLFDVSDFSDPKETAKFVTDEKYAQSNALYEHKAFLFSKDKELLVIPAYSHGYRDGDDKYNGAFVFRITRDEIELRGLIDHSRAMEEKYWYSPSVERSLWIEELLYTKSPNLLRINEISDLSSVKEIELKSSKIPIY